MDLKVAFVIACLCALAVSSTEAALPRCCFKTTQIKRRWLMKVERSYVQLSSGICDISALVLYLRGRKTPICAPLKQKAELENVQWAMNAYKINASL
ncbi:C-C motif chemokine 27a [Solea solea]|uniref:C-C motif chemokine 27a n=1 Tax=Solea solea TaxID=90069 RepID=UPI00272C7785|nr:C-C motif chemokine 27a [Solea solea]